MLFFQFTPQYCLRPPMLMHKTMQSHLTVLAWVLLLRREPLPMNGVGYMVSCSVLDGLYGTTAVVSVQVGMWFATLGQSFAACRFALPRALACYLKLDLVSSRLFALSVPSLGVRVFGFR